jgi:hypothetical protein
MKKRQFVPPTWEETNNEKLFVELGYTQEYAKLRVEQNNKLKDFLVENGWAFWEGFNGYENGYTIHAWKPVGIAAATEGRTHVHPRIHFEWFWYSCGGDEFFRGRMYSFYNYHPDYKFLGPAATFEINDILERNLKDLAHYEGAIKCAVLAQPLIPSTE